jgi:hypothetical protein
VTSLSIRRSVEPRTWALQDGYRLLAWLALGRAGAGSGELRSAEQTLPIVFRARRQDRVIVGEPADPLLELRRDEATLRGAAEPLPWAISGRRSRTRGVLGDGERTIVVETSGWRPEASVEVTGEWEHRDLVALACFFTLIARRRR